VKSVVATEVEKVLAPVAKPLEIDAAQKPFVILVVASTAPARPPTIGKLAAKLSAEGRKVMLAAGDTFSRRRDRATEDLGRAHQISGDRRCAGLGLREPRLPCADVRARGKLDVLLIDTAREAAEQGRIE